MTSAALFLFDVASWSAWRQWFSARSTVIAEHGTRIAFIIIVLIAFEVVFRRIVSHLLLRAVARAARVRQEDPLAVQRRADTLAATLHWGFGIFLLFLGAGLLLAEVGLNVSALIAGVGVVGIALGLGAQTLVRDVLNGMFILIEDQYGVGDLVTVAGATGTVVEINPRRTVLRDGDGNVHSIPNSSITVAVNRTPSLRRLHVTIDAPFHDLERAVQIANELGSALLETFGADVMVAPSVAAQTAVSETVVRLDVVGDIRPAARWGVEAEYRRRLKLRFAEERMRVTLVGISVQPTGN